MHPRELRIEDYTYELPDDRIARFPLADRDSSRLLVYRSGELDEDTTGHVAKYIPPGSLMVFNQARVVNARLIFQKETGGIIEVFCLAPHEQYPDIQTAMQQQESVRWECLVGGASKWKAGTLLHMHHSDPELTLSARMAEKRPGSYLLELSWDKPEMTFAEVLHHLGRVPLPPYLRREVQKSDADTYQTVYARDEGSVAAPTAGLHFTPEVLDDLQARGITKEFVTLHVGAGTFIPVKSDKMDGHDMHAEWIEVSQSAIEQLAEQQGPIVAVGTTSLRTLESLYWIGNQWLNGQTVNLQGIAVGQWTPYETKAEHSTTAALNAVRQYMKVHGMDKIITRTQILIAPGYRFRLVNGLFTNFHQPQSTLLLLVAALIGDDWRQVYNHALSNGFRFLSYGDACLLWEAG